MDLMLKDKIALVTGASQGLGRDICLALAAEGARVAVNYRRNPEIAEELVRELSTLHGVRALAVPGDVGRKADVVRIFDEVEQGLGRVDALVNNAAVAPTATVMEMDEEEWESTLRTNLTGTFFTCQEMVRRRLAAGGGGRIVNISSTSAYLGSTSGRAHYDASKGGINSFSVSLSREVARHGIAVNVVVPGLMITKMTAERMEANREKYLSRIPMNRYAETREIADVAVFLASERASYMTGATINVSGGLLMH